MGYVAVTEVRLQELRLKHRPAVLAIVEERSKGGRIWKDSKGLASKLYSFKHDPGSLIEEKKSSEGSDSLEDPDKSPLGSRSTNLDELLNCLSGDSDVDSLPDLQEQVAFSIFLFLLFLYVVPVLFINPIIKWTPCLLY